MSSKDKDLRELYFKAANKAMYEMKVEYLNKTFREMGFKNFDWRDIKWSKKDGL